MRYDTLTNHYEQTFALVQDFNWSWGDIQNMIPWERDIILMQLKRWIDRKNAENKNAAGG